MRLAAAIGPFALVTLLGCTLDDGLEPGVEVSDSAGVPTIMNTTPRWASDEVWQLSASPTVEIGSVEGQPEYLFDRIVGAVTLSDGRVAVADMGSSEVRVFDATGTHLLSIGSHGQGPGEFNQVIGLHRLPDDAIGVVDRLERILIFGPDGGHRQTIRIGTRSRAIDPLDYLENPAEDIRVLGWLEDGTFVGWRSSALVPPSDLRFDEPQTLEVTYSRFGPGEEVLNPILHTPGPTYQPHPLNLILRAVFGPELLASTDHRHLLVGLSGAGEVRWYNPDGELIRIGRRAWPNQPVTEDMIEEYLRRSSPRLSEEVLRARTFADELPKFSDLICDRAGNVWLRQYQAGHAATTYDYVRTFDSASTWSIFDQTGRWLGDVTTPARFSALEIGEDYVLGLYRDNYEVESVRVYRLAKVADG